MGYQLYIQALASLAISANAKLKVQLRDLEVALGNGFLHLVGFKISGFATFAYTTAPTLVGQNNLINQVRFHDGVLQQWQVSGNSIRIMEKAEAGRSLMAEAETDNATTNPRYFSRFIPLGDLGMEGVYRDFTRPAASLRNGYLAIDLGALTDISADCTAMGGTIEVEAIMTVREDLVFGPTVERREDDVGANAKLDGEALYLHLTAVTGSDYGNFAALELSNITAKSGTKVLVPTVASNVLWRAHQVVKQGGMVGGLMGEPANATYDTNTKQVNLGTPTALVTAPFDAQPILFTTPRAHISGCFAYVPSQLNVVISGNSTSHRLLSTRVLPNNEDNFERMRKAAADELGISTNALKFQLADKAARVPEGYRRFLPVKYKVQRKAA